jgi:hypothetical protein
MGLEEDERLRAGDLRTLGLDGKTCDAEELRKACTFVFVALEK